MSHRLHLCLPLALLALCGCATGPDFHPPTPAVPMAWPDAQPSELPQGTAIAAAPAPGPLDMQAWWRGFGDPGLDSLIDRALAANLDLRAAVLRIEEARAERAVTADAWWPSLSLNASYARTRLSEQTPTGSLFTTFDRVHIPGVTGISVANPYNQYQLGAGASWEPDLFGRVRRSVEAADAAVAVSTEDQHAAQLALLADVTRSYLELRAAQQSAQSALDSIAITEQLLELTRQRRAAGLGSDVDVVEAGAESSDSRAQLPTYELAITSNIHSLSRLLAQEPEALRGELSEPAALPSPPAGGVPLGLPAALTRQRPDIRRAEANLHAATAQIGAAIAGLYPRIALTAAGGVQSQTAGELTNWAGRFFTLGPTLELPLLDRGRWRTVTLQRVRERQAATAYAATVLMALQHTEDAISAWQADEARRAWLEDAVRQERDALGLSRQRYEAGVANFIEVLDVERSLRQDELALIRSTLAVDEDLVAVCRELGGGWN